MNKDYFTRYCGYGPYDENYLFHSGIEHCLSIVNHFEIPVRSVLVLGTATGKVLPHFETAWGARPWGCEISRWAHARIPGRYRRRIQCRDMRSYLPDLVLRRRSFDLIFSNSLVYLEAHEVAGFVELCARVCGHFHFWSSTSDDNEPGDRLRRTLRSKRWWLKVFREAGFTRTRSPYLWRSTRRAIWT